MAGKSREASLWGRDGSIRAGILGIVIIAYTACGGMSTTVDGDADADGDVERDTDVADEPVIDADQSQDADREPQEDADHESDICAPMDSHPGPDTCDGGGVGYKWDGERCMYQGDLCNCIGTECRSLFETEEECWNAYAPCLPDCDLLREELTVTFEAAVHCDPAMSSLQCDNTYLIRNYCGCEWSANNRSRREAMAALTAWYAYQAAGCVSPECPACPEPTPSFGCITLPVGTEGTCEIID